MTKIVIIGAGSGFGGKLSRDVLALPELREAPGGLEIALVDIDADKLDRVRRYVARIISGHELSARLSTTTERCEALVGANYVVTSISVGGPAYAGFPFKAEVEIPRKWGVDQTVADTIGVGGVFRFLRTAPVQLAVCRDMEAICPQALLLNYTNPMCMLTWLHTEGSKIRNVGLCHSVQNTIRELAGYLGLPKEEMDYWCAGINHQAWYLRLRHQGKDLYPALRACRENGEIVAKDRVRFEMFRHFGYFVTESSPHCSEYHPYFRRTEAERESFGLSSRTVSDVPTRQREWLENPEGGELPDLSLSGEYAAEIIRSEVANIPYRFNGNVMNTGLISNLPEACCVEVPCLVDRQGVQPTHIGPLPVPLAHLNLSNIAVQELAVRAILDRDKDAAFHACALDPLTRAVCSLAQIREMFEELWSAESEAGTAGSLSIMNLKMVFGILLLATLGTAAFRQTQMVETGPTPVRWRKIVVDPMFRSEGVAIADVNRDGRKDVIVGDCWYEAPDWKRHDIRPPRTDLGDGAGTYSDAFCCFIGDFNHDGWPDVLVVGFPGKPGYWYENPGSPTGQEPHYWKQHPVVDSVCNETPNYVDLFGDGHKYLVAATGGKMCWFSPSRDREKPWDQHSIGAPETAGGKAPGTEVFSHGLGFGDVNGDGRVDILVKQGWWEQPKNARSDEAAPWTFHPANFGDDCSNMYAFDINGDGLSDVLSASAHGRGIWWFQQQKDGSFVRHLIADEFTETHSLNLADIAGKGHRDFVTGKRWWAHGPHGDVDPNAAPVLYWFEIQPHKGEAPKFIGHRIDDASGVGTQFVTDDINGDKRVDVVVSNKRGVFIFEQL